MKKWNKKKKKLPAKTSRFLTLPRLHFSYLRFFSSSRLLTSLLRLFLHMNKWNLFQTSPKFFHFSDDKWSQRTWPTWRLDRTTCDTSWKIDKSKPKNCGRKTRKEENLTHKTRKSRDFIEKEKFAISQSQRKCVKDGTRVDWSPRGKFSRESKIHAKETPCNRREKG